MTEITNMQDIHYWNDYSPKEAQYYRYETHIIAAAHKIVDVYQALCSARTFYSYLDLEDYGDLISNDDKIHFKFIKSLFIQNALVYYNVIIDLSWQVLWLYYGMDSFDLMYEEEYIKSTKECTYRNLLIRLKYKSYFPSKERGTILSLLELVKDFFEDPLTKIVRDRYNYLKHRGTFYFDGLGKNYNQLGIKVNGFNPIMLTREEILVDDLKKTLYNFDVYFFNYFNTIIKNVMPADYFNNKFEFEDPLNYHFKLKEYFNHKNDS